MTTTNVSTASQEAPLVLPVAPLATQELPLATEALKDAIIALIKEKNPELRRLLRAEVFFCVLLSECDNLKKLSYLFKKNESLTTKCLFGRLIQI
jgi:hypothetical protein